MRKALLYTGELGKPHPDWRKAGHDSRLARYREGRCLIRDWLPTNALAVATTNIGQKRGCGMAAK